MNAIRSPRTLPSLSVAAVVALLVAMALPAQSAQAASTAATDQRIVDCLVPGQIRHGPGGTPMLGPRRSIKLSVADCQVRGGEYVVATVAAPAPAPTTRSREDQKIVNCLLPAQLRQLGRKVTYVKVLRPIRLARWDCRARGGQSVTAARYKAAQTTWLAAVAKSKPARKP